MKERANIIVAGSCHVGQAALIEDIDKLTKYKDTPMIKKHKKHMSNMGVNCAILDIDGTLDLHIWALQTAAYYEDKWVKLYQKSLGVILVIPATLEDIWGIHSMLNFFREKDIPVVVCLTNDQIISVSQIELVAEKLRINKDVISVYDVRSQKKIKALMLNLLLQVTKKSSLCRRYGNR